MTEQIEQTEFNFNNADSPLTAEKEPTSVKLKSKKKAKKDGDKFYHPYASPEELYFSWYLEELKAAGYVDQWSYEPWTFRLTPIQKYTVYQQLKTKVKHNRLSLFQSHEYTPDFGITWRHPAHEVFFHFIDDGVNLKSAPLISNKGGSNAYSIIEVKPDFDSNNMIRLFRINQKVLYADRRVYVQEIVPGKLFTKSFTPAKYLLTPTGKKKKLNYEPNTLQEFVNNVETINT